MCVPINEELGAVGGIVGGGESNDIGGVNDEVFVDAIEGGATESVGGVADANVGGAMGNEEVEGENNGGLNVVGADSVITIEDNGESVGGAVMDTDVGGEMDGGFITMEEVVGSFEDNGGNERGGDEEGGEGIRVDSVDNTGGDVSVQGEVEGDNSANVGEGSGCSGGGDEIGPNGSPTVPIPLIPRWRLREILAHAEGECGIV